MKTVLTPKKRKVVFTVEYHGPYKREVGHLRYGDIVVASWADFYEPNTSIYGALLAADKKIDELSIKVG